MAYLDVPKPVGNYMRYALTEPDRLVDPDPVDADTGATELFLEHVDILVSLVGRRRAASLVGQTWDALARDA